MGFLLPAAGMKGRIPAFPLPGGYSSLTRGGGGGIGVYKYYIFPSIEITSAVGSHFVITSIL